MPAPLNVAFNNQYNDVIQNRAIKIPTYSEQVKKSNEYKNNMIDMMNKSNTDTKSTPRFPWPVNCKSYYINKPHQHIQEQKPFYIRRKEYFGNSGPIVTNFMSKFIKDKQRLKIIQECLCYFITFIICVLIILLIMLIAF
tara:strand:+ start:1292 stop:1711 length:420 start_codon:yes stop_codon:yes gene_type:complete